MTVHEYDEQGRLVKTVSRPEPEWNDEDRDLMAGLWWVEADECHGCGLPMSETTDSQTDEDYRVPAPRRCQACTAIARAQNALEQSAKPEFSHALRWQVTPKT